MPSSIEVILLPYSGAAGRTLLDVLLKELGNPEWTRFRAAVAFASASGNFISLLDAMAGFLERGGIIEITFGADSFGVDLQGTERAAVETLLERFKDTESVKLHLYHERGRTFHPKLYLFSNANKDAALLIVGSSNWSYGGLVANVEADVILGLDLKSDQDRAAYNAVVECLAEYWQEVNE